MGLFDIFRKKSASTDSSGPYNNPALNKIYHMLFCDRVELFQFESAEKPYPWNKLLDESPDIPALQAIINDTGLETRAKIIAHKKLKALKVPSEKALLAVVIEVGLEKGLDTLAAYRDGTARLIHHSESLLVWDTVTPVSMQLINQLFLDSLNMVKQIPALKQKRKSRPPYGMVRISFIASDGLYFEEDPFNKMEKDSKSGPVIFAATRLMSFLIQQKNAGG